MSIKPIDCYTIVCDWPDCAADVMETSDYSGGDLTLVNEAFEDRCADGWHLGASEDRHYCDKHPAIWAHLLLDAGDPEPERPYLLIHDGDTGNPDDDGRVTLVRPITEVLLDEGNVPLPEVCS